MNTAKQEAIRRAREAIPLALRLHAKIIGLLAAMDRREFDWQLLCQSLAAMTREMVGCMRFIDIEVRDAKAVQKAKRP